MESSENNISLDPSTCSPPSANNRRRRHSTRKFERSDFVENATNIQTSANLRRNSDTNLYFEIFTNLPNSTRKMHQKNSPNTLDLTNQVNLKYKQNRPAPLPLHHENVYRNKNAPMSCPSNIPKMSYFNDVRKFPEPVTPKSNVRRKVLKASKQLYIDEFDDKPKIKNFGRKSSDEQSSENAHEGIKSWELSPRKHEMHRIRKLEIC